MFLRALATIGAVTHLSGAPETMGQRIARLRKAKGWSKQRLQNALGASYTTILAWESDEAYPSQKYLSALSVVLGVPTSVLRGEDDPVNEAQYDAWLAFLETQTGRDMTPAERRTLATLRFDAELPVEATPEDYYALLNAIRGITRRAS